MKSTLEYLVVVMIFLTAPLLGSHLTPQLAYRAVPQPVTYPRVRGQCNVCQEKSIAAWFAAYDACRAENPEGDPQICTALGDRARACYVRSHWVGECERCNGAIPDESECAE